MGYRREGKWGKGKGGRGFLEELFELSLKDRIMVDALKAAPISRNFPLMEEKANYKGMEAQGSDVC